MKIGMSVLVAGFMTVLFLLIQMPDNANGTLNEDDLQTQTKEVAKTLRCAVCQSESVWESNAELAIQMRDIIRERLQRGETPDQIRSYFVSRYGDFILLKPRTFGLNWLLWLGPFLILLAGGFYLIQSIRRWTRDSASEPLEPPGELDHDDQSKIDLEIRAFKN